MHYMLGSRGESYLLGWLGLVRKAFSKVVHHLSSLRTVLVLALKVQHTRKCLSPGQTGKISLIDESMNDYR